MSFRGVIFGQSQASRLPLFSLYAKSSRWLELHIYHTAHHSGSSSGLFSSNFQQSS